MLKTLALVSLITVRATKDGSSIHSSHKTSNAYASGQRKRRKIQNDQNQENVRWHKTGNAKPDLIPTVFDNFSADVVVEGTTVNLGLWDTAGQEDYNRLRPLSYRGADVFVFGQSCELCECAKEVDSVFVGQWIPEHQHFAPGVPVVLVGTKMDLGGDKL